MTLDSGHIPGAPRELPPKNVGHGASKPRRTTPSFAGLLLAPDSAFPGLQRESNAKCGRVGFVSLKCLKLLWHCGILWLIYMCPHGTPHEDRACVPSVWHRAGRKIDPPPRFVAGRREFPNALCRAWFEHMCVQTHVCSLVRWLTYRLKAVSSTSQMFPIGASS